MLCKLYLKLQKQSDKMSLVWFQIYFDVIFLDVPALRRLIFLDF